MFAQMKLHNLILKVEEHKLELVQELVIHILRLVVTNDNDAFIWIIKNMLEDGLSLDYIVNIMLEIVNAMIEKMADDWETDYEW